MSKRSATPRRQTDWVSFRLRDANGIGNPGPATAVYSLTDTGTGLVSQDDYTVERVVGDLMVYEPKDGAGVPSNFCLVHAGIIVMGHDSSAAVLVVDPTDGNDMNGPWLWMHHWTVVSASGLVPDFTVAGYAQGARYIHFDVHVRRKLAGQQILALIMSVQSLPQAGYDTTTTASLDAYVRTLVKLH